MCWCRPDSVVAWAVDSPTHQRDLNYPWALTRRRALHPLTRYGDVMSALENLEARVAALEAAQADYRAVLAAINALAANQREHVERSSRVEIKVDGLAGRVDGLASQVGDTNARVRSIEEAQAEFKDLLIRALDR